MRIEGAVADARAEPGARRVGATSYYLGNDPAGWVEGAPHHDAVTFREVLPGVDVRYYFRGELLEFDLILAPHADVRDVRLLFPGAQLKVGAEGALEARAHGATLTLPPPVSYQPEADGVLPVSSAYRASGESVTFALGPRARDLPLVIDPLLVFSGSFGGAGTDALVSVAGAPDGQLVMLGTTTSADLPTTPDAAQPLLAGSSDLVVARMPANDTLPTYLTYLGGASAESAGSIALDAAGAAYLVGTTRSADFPLRNDCGACAGGGADAAVAKITPTGALAYSLRFGGTDDTQGFGIAVAPDGTATIVGDTRGAAGFPFQRAWDSTFDGTFPDSFAARFTPTGGVVFASFLAGSGGDHARAVALAPDGEAVIVGDLRFSSFGERFPGDCPYEEIGGAAYVVFLRPDGSSPRLSRCFGGLSHNSAEEAHAVVVDAEGHVSVAGGTSARDWPPGDAAGWDAGDPFIASFSSAGAERFSLRLEGNGWDVARALALAPDGTVHIGGSTQSTDLALKGATQAARAGAKDAFIASVDRRGFLAFATYLGGPGGETARGMVVADGVLHVVGEGRAAAAGGSDALLARFAGTTSAPTSLTATPGAGEVALAWGPPASTLGTLAGYEVFRFDGAQWTHLNTTQGLEYLDAGLPPGATPVYIVRALSKPGGAGAFAATNASVHRLPAAPTSVAAERSTARGQIALSWQPPGETDGLPVLAYRIAWGDRSSARILLPDLPPQQLSFLHEGQPDGATRWYVVRALTAAGVGPESVQVQATTMAAPSAPRHATGASGPALGQTSLSWAEPADDGGAPLSAYQVWGGNASGPLALLAHLPSEARAWGEEGLQPGTTRRYVVHAVNEVGAGPGSPVVSVRAAARPAAPAVSVPAGNVAPRLAWTIADDGGIPLVSFTIHRGLSAGSLEPVAVVPGEARSWTDTTCPLHRVCHYRVHATNELGDGPLSNGVSRQGSALRLVVSGGTTYNDANGNGQRDPGEQLP